MLLLIISILELCGVALPTWVWIVGCVFGGISVLASSYRTEKNS